MRKLLMLSFAAILFLGSCSDMQKVLKNPSVDARYKAAEKYYQNEEYAKAGIIFEDLIPDVIGRPEAERVQYYYSYCHFHQKQYDLANYYFKSFHDTYQRSPFAIEALFMSAYANLKGTPEYNLDQSNTNNAINSLQDFINRYPDSQYVAKAEDAIRELRKKLETKSFEKAKLYQKLRRYKAAVIAYDNFRKSYPDSQFKEEAIFNRLASQAELAKLSVPSLKKERYAELVEMYYYFIDKYPASKHRKQAENIFRNSQKQLKDLNSKA
ncbi:MAG: outer membrane protein assembly factor BamD [Flammeovirgaceae bacterium]